MANDWSREEVEATVSDYFDMLAKELREEPFNKAEHNRNLQKFLANRTKGAVELKHQNISVLACVLPCALAKRSSCPFKCDPPSNPKTKSPRPTLRSDRDKS